MGDPNLSTRLNSLCQQQALSDRAYAIEIEPLTQQQTSQYLTQRFRAVGSVGKLPLTDSQIKKIWQCSRGIPANINQQTKKILSTPEKNHDRISKKTSTILQAVLLRSQKISSKHSLVALGLILAVIGASWMEKQKTSKPQAKPALQSILVEKTATIAAKTKFAEKKTVENSHSAIQAIENSRD